MAPRPETVHSLHALAEHVLAAALFEATGHIGLRVSPGGFSTPRFGDDRRSVRISGTTIVVASTAATVRQRLTTIGAAAALAGVAPGAPAAVYTPVTPCVPDAALDIDPASARSLAEWYSVGDGALRRWAVRNPAAPAVATLWPEHFDVAMEADGVTYGAAPADGFSPVPYLYVGAAPERRSSDPFWNAPFGAARSWADVPGARDAVGFFQSGRRHLRRDGDPPA